AEGRRHVEPGRRRQRGALPAPAESPAEPRYYVGPIRIDGAPHAEASQDARYECEQPGRRGDVRPRLESLEHSVLLAGKRRSETVVGNRQRPNAGSRALSRPVSTWPAMRRRKAASPSTAIEKSYQPYELSSDQCQISVRPGSIRCACVGCPYASVICTCATACPRFSISRVIPGSGS